MIDVKIFHIALVPMTIYSLTVRETTDGALYGVMAEDNISRLIYADITDQNDGLQELVSLCNKLELDVCQLEDVLEDFLC